jgi:hypothetical protein
VKTPVDARLRDEARRFVLRFACEDCGHWTGATCGNGWPGRVAREALEREDATEVVFCKEFELGER